jgi:hypothetical protein
MKTLEELKKDWALNPAHATHVGQSELSRVVRTRVKKHLNTSMQYFWGALVLQILVYALLTHVGIKYYYDPYTVAPALLGIALYVPFTWILLSRFKKMALSSTRRSGEGMPVREYIHNQKELLQGFLAFKKRYEWILIPISTAIGVLLVFKLYVPGGVAAFPQGAAITFALTLISCYMAIRRENARNFSAPLSRLSELENEYSAVEKNSENAS